MNSNMENPEAPKKRGRSIIFIAAFYGSVISTLLTIGAIFYGGLYGVLFISEPIGYLWKVFGFDTLKYYDLGMMQGFVCVILPTLTNAILFFIVGTFIG